MNGLPDSTAAALSPLPGAGPRGPTLTGTVVRVVDGDTVRVLLQGQREDVSVRLIGIDTPETVAPGRPVECFGPQASEFARQVLDGATVLLELDPSQGETDRFGRLLAYVWLQTDPQSLTQFNLAAVRAGFARQVQFAAPYAWQDEFESAESQARADATGLWGACDR